MKNKKLIEIQNIKNQNLVCLDFDDCIIEYLNPKTKTENPKETIIENLKKNIEIISDFCAKNNCLIFITSSWSNYLNKNLELIGIDKDFNYAREYWKIIKDLPFIGKDPFNDRILAIEVLLENKNKIICIDDLDLSHYFESNNNFKMLNVYNGKNLNKLKDLKF